MTKITQNRNWMAITTTKITYICRVPRRIAAYETTMKKEAIIDLIKSDLEEMGALVETFREPDKIANDFIELLRQKNESIGNEIRLLKYWSTERLCGNDEPELVAEVASSVAPSVRSGKTEREEVADYFSEEMDQMPDPFDGLFSGGLASAEDGGAMHAPLVARQDFVATPETEQKKDEESGGAGSANAQTEAPHPSDEDSKPSLTRDTAAPDVSAADIANYGTPVKDVTKAIGINDKFLYIRELFGGNKLTFDSAVATINAASSYQQAYQYLKQTYGWDETDPTVEAFLKAVHRRFL